MNFFVVRHGEVAYQFDDLGRKLIYDSTVPLAPVGEEQIRSVGKQLREEGLKLDAIFTSPFIRAEQSAAILQQELTVPVVTTVELLHDVFPNSWLGYPLEAFFEQTGGDGYSRPNPSGGDHETLEHLVQRAALARKQMAEISNEQGFQNIGIVSHGDTISALHWGLYRPEVPTSYHDMQSFFYLDKGQVAVYRFDQQLGVEGQPRIVTVPLVEASQEGLRRRVE